MQYDRKITISTGGSRKATYWQAQTMWWSEMVQRLSTAMRGKETLEQYKRLTKAEQDKLKDVGGFVGGLLSEGRRRNGAVAGRDLVTLDMDAIPSMGTDSAIKSMAALGCAYVVYSTRKHEPTKPRLRFVIPLDRTVTADEYEPIARKIAEMVGIAWCDPTTFQPVRMMYWPSCCSDSQYVFLSEDKPFASADGLLAQYPKWQDAAAWPQVPGVQAKEAQLAAKQEDPTAKSGIVGAFCKTYNIYQAMDEFLPGVYEPVDTEEGRYTYAGGSTTGGALIYDGGKYLFSHHGTDPCGGKLVNAFDLVRLHLYGMLDDETEIREGTPVGKHPSYVRMQQHAMDIDAVSLLLSQERLLQTAKDFSMPVDLDDTNWLLELSKHDKTGKYEKTVNNLVVILRHDPLLAGRIAHDDFSNRCMVSGPLPWDKREGKRQWTDADDNALFWYIEKRYDCVTERAQQRALDIVARERAYNDVVAFLDSLVWDGVPRLDTLFIDYLSAEDTPYTRAVTRKMFVAAVARAYVPGTKFDYSAVLVGLQGIGKSTLLRKMGKAWFLEDLPADLSGKDACELLQGRWLVEMGELTGLTRSEVSVVKAFLSRTTDVYREPYGRRTGEYPRRCVIFGSTNDDEFLRDVTGNRRFWPVTLLDTPSKRSIFTELDANVDQIWAEAKARFSIGEPLTLPQEIGKMAKAKQEQYRVSDARAGIIAEFVERPLPKGWEQRGINARRTYWNSEFGQRDTAETEPRKRVCAVEIWCECFGREKGQMRQADTREINALLRQIGWMPMGVQRDKIYGNQRSYAATDEV